MSIGAALKGGYRLSAIALIVAVPLWLNDHFLHAPHRDAFYATDHHHGGHSHEDEGHSPHSASDHELPSAHVRDLPAPALPVFTLAHVACLPDLSGSGDPDYRPDATGDPPPRPGYHPDRPARAPPAPRII